MGVVNLNPITSITFFLSCYSQHVKLDLFSFLNCSMHGGKLALTLSGTLHQYSLPEKISVEVLKDGNSTRSKLCPAYAKTCFSLNRYHFSLGGGNK